MPERNHCLCWLAILLLVFPFVPACRNGSPESESGRITLVLGAYTTPREAYGRSIIPAFQRYWKNKTGQEVEFRQSYQGSGAQARSVIGGFEADVIALSLAGDVEKVVKAGLIKHDWQQKPHQGMVSTSIVVLAVRPGNPKQIRDWPDLARSGLNVLTPDPRTSGGAMWNICAMYGAALRGYAGVEKDKPEAGADFLKAVFRNVAIMDKGARESITNFEKGIGDAAITYENEVLVGRAAGQKYDYAIPRSTILIENPAALVDTYVDKHGVRPVAEAFLEFLWSKESQRAFAEHGLRSVDTDIAREFEAKYPAVQDLWTIGFLGGWPRVIQDIFGPAGVYTRAYQGLHGDR
ncbi:MAG: sulfate ABC transporter substrate-binding protein [Acidobacteria bacterium]|nr:MAG: sulfate ABC transporter substrate-binding protein [Acidobacteriota bacterium]